MASLTVSGSAGSTSATAAAATTTTTTNMNTAGWCHDHSLLVLYGSQTGNAQEVAERVGRDACVRGFRRDGGRVRVLAMDDYYPDRAQLASESLVIFVVATTGDGDPPDNMRQFWRFLRRRSLPHSALAGVHFGVFGLGDSSYVNFNVMARKVAARMRQLGAVLWPLTQIHLGDDQSSGGVHADVDTWMDIMWKELLRHPKYRLPKDFIIDDSPRLLAPTYKLTYASDSSVASLTLEDAARNEAGRRFYKCPLNSHGSGNEDQNPCFATLVSNERITAAAWSQDVRLLTFDTQKRSGNEEQLLPLEYNAGDVAVLHCLNDRAKCEAFCKAMGYDPQRIISDIQRQDKNVDLVDIPTPCRVVELFERYLDLFGLPRRHFFAQLFHFVRKDTGTDTDTEKAEEVFQETRGKLLELASSSGADLYFEYCVREKKTYAEVLMEDFKTCRPLPLEYLIQWLPRLRPREFSIACSPKTHGETEPGTLQLCVAIVRFMTIWKRKREGICTSWIAGLDGGAGYRIPMWIKKGSFRVPYIDQEYEREEGDESAPLSSKPVASISHFAPMILIGAGTGVAPLRSLLEEKWAACGCESLSRNISTAACYDGIEKEEGVGEKSHKLKKVVRDHSDILLFGCRHKAQDYYFSSQWEAMSQETNADQPRHQPHLCAFQAFSRDQTAKVYVQGIMRLSPVCQILWEKINSHGAYIFVAGNSKLPSAVAKSLQWISQECGGLDEETAERFVKYLKKSGRFVCECWS